MARKVIGMAREVAGPPGSRRRHWAVLLSFVVVVAASLVFMRTVLAVHETGAFELDGDATSQSFTSPSADDWDKVCYQQAIEDGLTPANAQLRCTASVPTQANAFGTQVGAKAVAWAVETDRAATIFTGGGSKDPQDINQWAWKNDPDAGDELHGGLPDKDNLLHAFAARYSLDPTVSTGGCPNGTPDPPTATVPCEVLYFGSDRFDNSGDAQQAFWFLKNQVTLGFNKVGGGNGFTGLHAAGDLLIISDFSNGGTVSTISVYKWDPTCKGTGKPKTGGVDGLFCADANLERLATSDDANCGSLSIPDSDPFCGLVNSDAIIMPWEFVDKSGTPNNNALNGEFYEAGINLSLLNLGNACFSSLVAETRSSTSTTATLKDFLLGQFANCVPGMTTLASADAATPVIPGFEVHDTATIVVTGVTNPPDPTGTVTFFLCGPTATATACTSGGTNVGTGTLAGGTNTEDGTAVATSPDVNTDASPLAAGIYCFRATWPGNLPQYPAQSHTNATTECFAVKDTSAITTAQKWLPNDTAHVTTGSGAAAVGTVTFKLYGTADCTGDELVDPFADRPVDASGNAATNNTTQYVVSTPGATISWRAEFFPTDLTAFAGSTSHCETSTVTIDDDTGQ